MNSCGHFCLNIASSATAQSLATGFADWSASQPAVDMPATAPIRWLSLQPLSANAGVIYVGFAGSLLSSSNFAFRIEAPVATVPSAPFIIEGLMISLDKVFISGTSGDDVAVGYIRG